MPYPSLRLLQVFLNVQFFFQCTGPSQAVMTETRKLGSIFNPFSDSFSVDGFLSRKTATIGLEKLRDDLGVYLKILRSAMIELINEDYAGKNSLARMKRAYSVIIT